MRIDFTHYATGQRLVGLKSLVLKNLWQDPSMLREALAMAMFNRMGQPAPRTGRNISIWASGLITGRPSRDHRRSDRCAIEAALRLRSCVIRK